MLEFQFFAFVFFVPFLVGLKMYSSMVERFNFAEEGKRFVVEWLSQPKWLCSDDFNLFLLAYSYDFGDTSSLPIDIHFNSVKGIIDFS